MEKIDGIGLGEFVSLAITEIANGVTVACNDLLEADVLINPITENDNSISTTHKGRRLWLKASTNPS